MTYKLLSGLLPNKGRLLHAGNKIPLPIAVLTLISTVLCRTDLESVANTRNNEGILSGTTSGPA